MQAFAAALYRDAPGPFVDADAAYVCAFSLMMLNTDLHNPAVRAKMSLAEFAENNCGVNGGHDRPSPIPSPIRAPHLKTEPSPGPHPHPHPLQAGRTCRPQTISPLPGG